MGCNDPAPRPIWSGIDVALSAVPAPQAMLEIRNRKIAAQAANKRGDGQAPPARAATTPNPNAMPLGGETGEGKRRWGGGAV